jgi:hypothetical protein
METDKLKQRGDCVQVQSQQADNSLEYPHWLWMTALPPLVSTVTD